MYNNYGKGIPTVVVLCSKLVQLVSICKLDREEHTKCSVVELRNERLINLVQSCHHSTYLLLSTVV